MLYSYFKRHDYDKSQTVVSLIEKSMETYRDRTAVVFNGKKMTYGELDVLSGKVAQFLIKHGAEKDKAVAILLPRTEMIVPAALGVLRSGGCYQPLDPTYPDERLEFMVEDSGAKVLITDAEMKKKLPGFKGLVLDVGEIAALPEMRGEYPSIDTDSLFVLLYTSGSTGIPKGVMLEHQNLVAFIDWYVRYYEMDENTRTAAYASFGFDAIMMDIYPVLTVGGQVHIIDEAIRTDFPVLHQYFEDNGITVSFITTQVGRQFARLYPESRTLRHLSVGGETLVPIEPPKGYKLYNAYGPTECTIFTSCFLIDRMYDSVPIGYPLDNIRVYIVDADGKQVENGQEGELWVSGPQVARGYLKRPEKTAEVFRKNPFSSEPGYDRVYCTGDIVVGGDDGIIEIIGRRDTQVKIRGFRIELSEIEEIIRRFEGIGDATVAAFDKPTGGKYIAAYVVSDERVDTDVLAAFIARSKPPYMVPAVIMQIDSIPLNQNQKVDRRRLPVPEMKNEGYEPPRTDMEKMICEKMKVSLELEQVGANDDFFEIGGDSITTIRLIMECDHPGVDTASIYKYRTPRKIASYCESLGDTDKIDAANREAMKRPWNLTYSMAEHLRIQLADPDSTGFNEAMLYRLAKGVDADRFALAVNKVLMNHPVFGTVIKETEDGGYRQVYDPFVFTPVEVTDISDGEFEQQKKDFVKPFDVTGGPLYRIRILRTGSAAYFYMEIHHLISDGFSFTILYDEIYRCYQDADCVLPADYYYYILKENEESAGTDLYKEAERYCGELFRGADSLPESAMPLAPDHDSLDGKGAVKVLPLPFPKEKARGNIPGLTAALLAVSEYNGTDRAFIRAASNGRNSRMKMNSFGLYATYYPVFLSKGENDTPEELIEKVRRQVEFLDAHSAYPYFEGNVEKPENTVRFIYQQDSVSMGHFKELISEEIKLDTKSDDATDSLYGMSVIDVDEVEKLLFVQRYVKESYEDSGIMRMYGLFAKYLGWLTGEEGQA